MFLKTAAFYDALYHFKDYPAASAKLRGLMQRANPSAVTLLDVGCGTGKHLEHLRQWFRVEGMDLNPDLLAVAHERCPDVPLHQGDMVNFSLERRFDIVTCLFSALAYVRTVDRMYAAVANMARHLNPGGVLIIEPWFSPERLWTGHITANFVDQPDLKIAWMYTTVLEDRVTVLDIHYMVGTPRSVDSFTERHELGVFTDAGYSDALRQSGMTVEHDPIGLFARGLFVGVRHPEKATRGSTETAVLNPSGQS
jgi:SAM-dependent methyltransferase